MPKGMLAFQYLVINKEQNLVKIKFRYSHYKFLFRILPHCIIGRFHTMQSFVSVYTLKHIQFTKT